MLLVVMVLITASFTRRCGVLEKAYHEHRCHMETTTLIEFLKEIELEQYYDTLVQKGYTQVCDLIESDLVDLIPNSFELRKLRIEIDRKFELELGKVLVFSSVIIGCVGRSLPTS